MKLKSPTGTALAAAVGSNANNLRTSFWVRSCTDATTYRFESAAFDLLFSRFGVMFFAEPARDILLALSNVRFWGKADISRTFPNVCF
jgi:hypothetical protein